MAVRSLVWTRPVVLSLRGVRPYSSSADAPSKPLASSFYETPGSASGTLGTPASLSLSDRTTLEGMLRVDHAGEVAANTIYEAQANVFALLGDKRNKELALEMWETEKKHLRVAQQLLDQHHARPSVLLPIWGMAGSVLGAATAVLGNKAAMACTEAVETVIGEHYDDQLVHLRHITGQNKDPIAERVHEAHLSAKVPETTKPDDEEADASLTLLSDVITEFRDDELGHLDTAVEHDAQQAPHHALLSAIVGYGCKAAIQVASRI